ncbi:MAG: glycosyltransferase family 4 protein [Rhodospirillales bacterium]|nr:MAG: glycosyltransferase family 4 protein [Rhodospirillales bacterium]
MTAAVAIAALAAAVFAATAFGTGAVRRLLLGWAVLDHPNARSSHAVATPRGGGLAVVPVVLAAWLAVALGVVPTHREAVFVCTAAAVLAAVSWMDDLRGLSAAFRLGTQAAAVALVLAAAPLPGPVFAGWLPAPLDVAAAGLLWLWFINLFNFMDGIDGIAGVETATLGLGVAVVAAIAGLGLGLPLFGLVMAAAALGFLVWNWPPARLFLGDVGSIPLGFLLGWLLLHLAASGQPVAALILPLYYLADASITLARRTMRGARPWQAHREHFYQRAVQAGVGHGWVVRRVLAVNMILMALAALAALGHGGAALAAACVAVGILLMVLAPPKRVAAGPRSGSHDPPGKEP